jgi:hypothetical protein
VSTSGAPTTTNPAASAADDVINNVIQAGVRAADDAIESAIVAAVPALALPVVHQMVDVIVETVAGVVGNAISKQAQLVGTFIIIDAQVSGEQTALSNALKNLILAEQGGDPHAIQVAIQAYADAQSALLHDDGSAAPRT